MLFFLTFFFLSSYCALDIEPIVFVGPLGGQGLECKLEKAEEPHFWCFKNANWFRIWMNVWEEIPFLSLDCLMNNLDVFFDTKTKTYSNGKGVSIRPADFGGMGAFEYLAKGPIVHKKSSYMHNWMKFLESKGYKVGKSLRGASYDWRQGPKEWEKNEEWGFPAVKKMIEEMYETNEQKKVHVMGHSLGGPTAGYFLSTFSSQEWKDKYIASFISLGGAFDGAFVSPFLNIIGDNFYQPFKPDAQWLKIMSKIGGTQWMTPQFLRMDEDFIHTRERSYSMNQYKELMDDAKTPISYDIYEWETQALKNKPPGVTTYCLYGTGLPTGVEFYVDDLTNALTNKNYTVLKTSDGDSVVHIESLQVCDNFAKMQTQPVHVIQYPGLSHSPMVMNQTVWDDVLKITTKEKKFVKLLPTINLKY